MCNEGDVHAEEEELNQAVHRYLTVLNLVPVPKHVWEASTCIYTTLGDAYFDHGESLAECRETNRAKEYLLKTYMLEGYVIFSEEMKNTMS
ncbi:hypothetical protein ASD24_05525 [Paenibacillus sp. Root52]|uniref:Uncharacterized protein n=1 Tax=Paenibacillus amylolyticus TaxID=1451 RepID=A0AAP5H7X0_PAEAM|nr:MULTISPECIES: hypothetical protein [Paenibacillus]KQY87321.1 hypothetical protein ASD24_05525 [Paenibacillus sp. Root52]MDR6725551.1 hypothetical protein [Paenibacillus amylolyticus]